MVWEEQRMMHILSTFMSEEHDFLNSMTSRTYANFQQNIFTDKNCGNVQTLASHNFMIFM